MRGVASRVRQRRLELNLTQKGLAERAGIPLATYRRFESIGEISLRNLVLIATAFGMVDGILNLFAERRYENIDEVITYRARAPRKRGRKNE
ncbi:MAG: helix-turn-helix transcriptional regulator [Clostridiales Family XIII bacterium]|nr:helix-turn-helix transcriptional regulator [Clostridiales Family XIII bacterium]